MPISPALVFSIIVAGLYATVFHLLWGKKVSELPLLWLLSLLGFGAGQMVAGVLGLRLLMIGNVHFLLGTIACWLVLFGVKWRRA